MFGSTRQAGSSFLALALFVSHSAWSAEDTAKAMAPDTVIAEVGAGADDAGMFTKALRLVGMDNTFEHQFGDNFFKAYWKANPDAGITVGEFEFADHMVVPDAKSRAKAIGRLNKWLSQLYRFDPASLSEVSRGDWYLLDNAFEAQRWELTEYREWQWNPALYDVSSPFAVLLRTEYAPLEQRLRTILTRLEDVTAYYGAAKQNLTEPTREHTQLAIELNQRGLAILRDELPKQVAASNLRDSERALFVRRIAAACTSIEDYISWLQALDYQLEQRGARSFRVGRALYEKKFTYAIQSGGTADGLYQRAREEKEALHAHMAQVATALWPKYFAGAPLPEDRLDRIARMLAKLADQGVGASPGVLVTPGQLASVAASDAEPVSRIKSIFGNGITVEGWSAYNQLIKVESQNSTPEAWLAYSRASLDAVCDALLDYGVHTQDLNEQDAMRLLTREAFLSEEAAQRKWHQAQLTSVQLVGNFAGYSEIYDLREKLRHELGNRFDLPRFNETFASFGSAPVKVIKDLMRPALMAQSP